MSVSVILHSLPGESDTWGSYIDHFRQIPGGGCQEVCV